MSGNNERTVVINNMSEDIQTMIKINVFRFFQTKEVLCWALKIDEEVGFARIQYRKFVDFDERVLLSSEIGYATFDANYMDIIGEDLCLEQDYMALGKDGMCFYVFMLDTGQWGALAPIREY